MSVLCLIANPAEPVLDTATIALVQREVGGEINWLDRDIACELIEPKATEPVRVARDLVGGKPIDVALVSQNNRRKRLLIADMDSTMIQQECIDELAAALGIKAEVAAITDRAMRGELDFEAALDTRVALLKGLPRKQIEEIRREQITLMPGGRALVQTMKAYGAYTAMISGGFTLFADYFAKRIGFDEVLANVLLFEGDILAGAVQKPIIDKDSKLKRLLALVDELGIPIEASMAVGDGANDLPMLMASGLGVAIHAKPVVAAQAHVRIDHGDLTALLYLQGYEGEEFVR